MNVIITPFEEVVAFHGHKCPGLAIGYRAAEAALGELGAGRPEDEELVAIVENDACGVDAIQYVTGCTLGKGNLIFRDYGKHVYTIINRRTGEAVRVAERPDFSLERIDARSGELRRKVTAGTASADEEREFRDRMDKMIETILSMPAEEIFTICPTEVEIPEKARLFRSLPCAGCGEMVSESRARVQEGKIVCIPCFEQYSRGW
ncbi:MAG TPA: FmdE family protein [Methanoregulaceae archaeon]|nr:FmdE family protein [Methanoregulaceae archaeon]